MLEGWTSMVENEFYRGNLAELYRRAVKQHGYRATPPLITEARWKSDGYTTLVVVSLANGLVYGYGIAVKGPKDRYSELDGIDIATRKALDNAIIILKQKDEVFSIRKAIENQEENNESELSRIPPSEIQRWLTKVGLRSQYAEAVDHKATQNT